jgi:hypothetical protein
MINPPAAGRLPTVVFPYSEHKLSVPAEAHSERRLLTGFAMAALIA